MKQAFLLEPRPDWLDEISDVHAPDNCLTLREAEAILARCSLWWRGTPVLDGRRVGAVGHFSAADPESGAALLERASIELVRAGCHTIVGPMDGDTWHPYRLVTGGWDETPRFFLEPWNGRMEPEAFRAAGFRVLARYSSSLLQLEPPEEREARRFERLEARLARRDVVIRPIRLERFHEDLDALFSLSLESFCDNFLYTPIERRTFMALYAPVQPMVIPELALLAEKREKPVGFVFSVPDALAPAGRRRLVTKTLAVHPRYRHLGLGSVLIERVQNAARLSGFTEAIHALQFERNLSLKITRRQGGRRIREYALFTRSANS